MIPCDCSEYECKLPNSSICEKDKGYIAPDFIIPYLHIIEDVWKDEKTDVNTEAPSSSD